MSSDDPFNPWEAVAPFDTEEDDEEDDLETLVVGGEAG